MARVRLMIILIGAAAFAAGWGFYAYGALRTWNGGFGFSIDSAILSLLNSFLFSAIPFSTSFVVAGVLRVYPNLRPFRVAGGVTAAGAIWLMMELWVIHTTSAEFAIGSFFLLAGPAALTAAILATPRLTVAKAILTAAIGLLGGSVFSEVAILWDESRFVGEVANMPEQVRYTRSRAWPNDTKLLVYTQRSGFRATD